MGRQAGENNKMMKNNNIEQSRSNWIAQNEKVYSRKEVIEAVNGVLERLGVCLK